MLSFPFTTLDLLQVNFGKACFPSSRFVHADLCSMLSCVYVFFFSG